MWSLGVLIGVPLTALLVVGLLVGAVFCYRYAAKYPTSSDAVPARWSARGLIVSAVVTIGIAAIVLYPFSAEYHQWKAYTGVVARVNSRIFSQDKEINQRFVFQLRGTGDRLLGCDDTRCSQVHVGDTVALRCKREYQYASVSGYACHWNER